MAFVVQPILDNFRNYVVNVTSAAGGDTGQVLIDPTLLDPPCLNLRVKRIAYDIAGTGTVSLTWDATAQYPLLNLSSGPGQGMDFCAFGGIPNGAGAGKTGKINITSSATFAYTLVIEFVKSDPVNKL